MTSKQQRILLIFLATSLLVASSFYYFINIQQQRAITNKNGEDNKPETELGLSSKPKPVTTFQQKLNKIQIEPRNQSTAEKLLTSFRNSSSAEASKLIIDQAYLIDEAAAKELEYKLFAQCETHQNSVPKTTLTKSDWFGNKIQEYCTSYTPTISTAEFKKHGEVSIKILHTHTRQTRKIIKSLGPTDRGDTLARMIVNARSSDELDIIKRGIHGFNKTYRGIPFAELKYPYTYTRYALADPYWAAIDLYSCGKFGGCESDSFYTLMLCHELGACDPGWSLYDMYFNTLSANDLANAFTILQFIYDTESSG